LDDVSPPLGFRQTQSLDFSTWNGDPVDESFSRLIASARQFIDYQAVDRRQHAAVAAPAKPSARSRRPLVVAAIVMLVLGVGLIEFIEWRGLFSPDLQQNGEAANTGRIEVTDFETLEESAELDRYARETTVAIVRALATGGVKTGLLRAPTKNGNQSAASAEFALRGRIERDGEAFAISADVVSSRDSVVLWSVTRKGDATQLGVLKEVFAIAAAATLRCASRNRALSNAM